MVNSHKELLRICLKAMGCIGLALILSSCQNGQSCVELLENKCSSCHSLSTNCAKIGKSQREWQHIIDAMIKLNAKVSVKERNKLAKCLSQSSGEVKEMCN